jgi:chromosome segregation ATPase
LQQYARDLAGTDKRLRDNENRFEEQYEDELTRISDQEEKFNQILSDIRAHKTEVERKIKGCLQESSEILASISEINKEAALLDQTARGISFTQIDRVGEALVDNLERELIDQQRRLQEASFSIDDFRATLTELESKSASHKAFLDETLSIKSSYEHKLTELQEEHQLQKSTVLSAMTSNEDNSKDTSSQILRLQAEKSIIAKSLHELSHKLQQIEDELIRFRTDVEPRRKKLILDSQSIDEIRTKTRTFQDLFDRRCEFLRGIETSRHRAALREVELENELELIRTHFRKVQVDKFVKEEEIESHEAMKQSLVEVLNEIEAEGSLFQEEEATFERDYSEVSMVYSRMENDEREHQNIIDEMRRVYKELKERIAAMLQDEEGIVNRLAILKSPENLEFTNLNQDQRKRMDIILKGYETKIIYTRDLCANLQNSVKIEALKLDVGRSECRRISQGKGTNFEELKADFDERQKERHSKIMLLAEEVNGLESRKTELQNELTERRLALVSKSGVLNEDEENVGKVCFLEEFCALGAKELEEIEKSIEKWKSDGGLETVRIKDWFGVVTGVIDSFDELSVRRNVS